LQTLDGIINSEILKEFPSFKLIDEWLLFVEKYIAEGSHTKAKLMISLCLSDLSRMTGKAADPDRKQLLLQKKDYLKSMLDMLPPSDDPETYNFAELKQILEVVQSLIEKDYLDLAEIVLNEYEIISGEIKNYCLIHDLCVNKPEKDGVKNHVEENSGSESLWDKKTEQLLIEALRSNLLQLNSIKNQIESQIEE
jgi:hypothetical protein